mmetsp:Transcript_51233/g.122768  ORF Transcript_51233/g.122768 Transcript_51233/m.122768 type:complete len:364 (-) Transcript_51233:153-1244(-)
MPLVSGCVQLLHGLLELRPLQALPAVQLQPVQGEHEVPLRGLPAAVSIHQAPECLDAQLLHVLTHLHLPGAVLELREAHTATAVGVDHLEQVRPHLRRVETCGRTPQPGHATRKLLGSQEHLLHTQLRHIPVHSLADLPGSLLQLRGGAVHPAHKGQELPQRHPHVALVVHGLPELVQLVVRQILRREPEAIEAAAHRALQVVQGDEASTLEVDLEKDLVPVASCLVPHRPGLVEPPHRPLHGLHFRFGPGGQIHAVEELDHLLDAHLPGVIRVQLAPQHQQLVPRDAGAQALPDGGLQLIEADAPRAVHIAVAKEAHPGLSCRAVDASLVVVARHRICEQAGQLLHSSASRGVAAQGHLAAL